MKLSQTFNESEAVETLLAVGRERLTAKQKNILKFLSSQGTADNVTNMVGILAQKMCCSKSAVWNNLKSLKRARLISFGCMKKRGDPVTLTKAGIMIANNLEVSNVSQACVQ